MKTGSTSQHFLASFESREAVDDGFGNTVSGPFTERFQEMAAFIYGGGSEGMEAARLEGRETYKLRLRANANTLQITTEWRIRLVETGVFYAVKSIDAVSDRGWIWMRVRSGVAA